ncbi:MAG: translation initiation factor IF-2 subunit alpha [Candidatus Methanomethylicota archaeon]|uniref:Translation initiation factor 2 subunit alpha n=1 Tax=Thermoproteota archaeon TaxID=2056631 RepID=A0A497ESH9_9CREN|nr:MAG: translation initiation factor IF-2 subunit alpha [Candidatus Verstraetearchaeota archaeon]
MPIKRRAFPEVGDLVIATTTSIHEHGAYVKLDEYDGKEGYIPIGEVSSTWVRNIRDYIKEGQKVVLKVIRVDERKGHIDLSLRRVTDKERKEKLVEWKREQKALKLLELAAKSLGVDAKQFIEDVGVKIEGHYGDLYSGFEAMVLKGHEALKPLKIAENWANKLIEIAREHIEVQQVAISGTLSLTSTKPTGIESIRKALMEALKAAVNLADKVEITAIGAPRYRVEVIARDYKTAEEALKRVVDTALKVISEEGGSGSFTR